MFTKLLITFIEIPTPLNNGIITQDKMGPRLVNWPTANSRYIKGIPTSNRNIKNGIKNAPKKFTNK